MEFFLGLSFAVEGVWFHGGRGGGGEKEEQEEEQERRRSRRRSRRRRRRWKKKKNKRKKWGKQKMTMSGDPDHVGFRSPPPKGETGLCCGVFILEAVPVSCSNTKSRPLEDNS